MDSRPEKPSVALLADAVESFVHEMDAVRELLSVTSKSTAHLDDSNQALLDLIADRLPQTSPSQRKAAVDRWNAALDEMDPDKDASGTNEEASDEVADKEKPSFTAFKAAARDIGNLLGNPDAFTYLIHAWGESIRRPRRTPLLRAALLTTAVSGFEVLVSRIVSTFFMLRPAALRLSETKYTLADIEGFASLDEFREHCADRYVDSLMFGGLDDWVAWFSKQLKVSWEDFSQKPDSIREIFQRRHLVVHNGGVVNRQYLRKLPNLDAPPAVGSRLFVGKKYCEASIDELTRVGVLLTARVIRKLDEAESLTDRTADSLINSVTFRFLKQDRYNLVVSLIDNEIDMCSDDYLTQLMRVNRWIARKSLRGLDDIRKEVAGWQNGALDKRFKLAELALLDRNEDALKLGLELRGMGDISIEDWLTWPLLRGVREYEADLAMVKGASIAEDPGEG